MKIVSGNSNVPLANSISKYLGVDLVEATIKYNVLCAEIILHSLKPKWLLPVKVIGDDMMNVDTMKLTHPLRQQSIS